VGIGIQTEKMTEDDGERRQASQTVEFVTPAAWNFPFDA
jgi:hypothetical protein